MPIHLGEVLFPLRYDVWAQAPAIKELSRLCGDTLGMLEAGRDTAIYRHGVVACSVYQAIGLVKLLTGETLEAWTERHYRNRMDKLLSLYESIKQGWDRRQSRIYFNRVANPTTTTIGNPVPDGLFLSEGQHRTAVLLALGYTELPDYIAGTMVRYGSTYQPLDMTHAYIKAGLCAKQQFVDFARFRYTDIPGKTTTIEGLRAWAEEAGMPGWFIDYLGIYWGVK